MVMDASGSVGVYNFLTMKTFVANLTKSFQIGRDATHVGVITFSSTARIEVPIGSINDSQSLVNAINSIVYTRGGTSTHTALDLALSVLTNNSRSNEGVPRIVVLLTDGYSNSQFLTINSATKVHDANIQVYSFGIGLNVNEAELLAIASEESYVYHINNFTAESFSSVLRPLQLSACLSKIIVVVIPELLYVLIAVWMKCRHNYYFYF